MVLSYSRHEKLCDLKLTLTHMFFDKPTLHVGPKVEALSF